MMTLVQEAIRAEQIGDIFGRYRSANLDHIQTINATISELAGLAWALREINTLLASEYNINLYLIEDDLKLVHDCVTCTLQEVWHIIGYLPKVANGQWTPADFQRNWKEIMKYCRKSGKQDLSTRLDIYRRFLLALCATLKSSTHLRDEIRALRKVIRNIAPAEVQKLLKDSPEVEAADALVVVKNGKVQKQRSYERQRDGAPISPSESESSSTPWIFPAPEPVPSPPMSPSNTFSSLSMISSTEREPEHWAKQIFREMPSYTPLLDSGGKSKFYEYPDQPNQSDPGPSYVSAVVISFPPNPPGLTVSLVYRHKDGRAKMTARWRDNKGRSCLACLPLDMLEIDRAGPMLHIERRGTGHRSFKWLSLNFTTVEMLVLFHSTFLSMRARDGKKPVKPRDDWQLQDEETEFAGKCRQNGYPYALFIFRDKVSKAIRLQASIRGGALDKTPVWTAFVTKSIASKTWCDRIDRTVVCLHELQPRIFGDEYEFQRQRDGSFVINFESREDTKDFIARVEDLGRDRRHGR